MLKDTASGLSVLALVALVLVICAMAQGGPA
jgi:hypothetical protein